LFYVLARQRLGRRGTVCLFRLTYLIFLSFVLSISHCER
jgi:hypothetical protein